MAESAGSEIDRLRRRIDDLDLQLVELLNERARLGIAVGHAKLAAGLRTIRDPGREADVLDRVVAANGGPLPDADVIALYRRLMAATRRLESASRRRDAGVIEDLPTEP